MQPVREVHGALSIRHYPFLGFDHFVAKARAGSAALDRTGLPVDVGEHRRDRAGRSDAALAASWQAICDEEMVEDVLGSPLGLAGTGTGTGSVPC